jgi:NAD(P)-dependent dehydrogenase (short-subunit alcohol dehydrogenase family)
VARTEGALESLSRRIENAGGEATMIPFDLLEFDRIDDLGAEIYRLWNGLDILVGNAGILGHLSPVGHIKPEDWQRVIDLNLTANWRLLRIFDPLLQRSNAGRAVFLTCEAAHDFRAFWGAYSTSKAGLEALVKCYAQECQTTNIRANLLDPGPVHTNLRTKAYPGEDSETLTKPRELGPLLVEMCSPAFDKNGETVLFKA